MSDTDHTSGSDVVAGPQGESNGGLVDASTVTEYARRGLQSTLVTGIVGGAVLLQGVRALRAGRRWRGIGGLLVGGAFLAMALAQRESGGLGGSDVEPTDVVDTAPDIEDVAAESGDREPASGGEASAVVDTAPDVEDAGSGPEVESDVSGSVDQTDVVDTGVETDEAESESTE